MTFDYKKEYKEYYLPKNKPVLVSIPTMNYIAINGHGDPNDEKGEYKDALSLLYSIAFTLKMSYKTDYRIEGYFSYVVPPLEGLWWQNNSNTIDYQHKEDFNWISMIRLPDFITKKDVDWAITTANAKKQKSHSQVYFFTLEEGLCVQCMHRGSFDDDPATLELIHSYIDNNDLLTDISETRRHHEIYLSDPRKCKAENIKTVLRIPVRKK